MEIDQIKLSRSTIQRRIWLILKKFLQQQESTVQWTAASVMAHPIGNGFFAYPQNMKFGVRVSSGNIGE